MLTFLKNERYFNYSVIALIILILTGITLLFTPFTRSVFEVNKLMVFRIGTLLILFLWFVHSLFSEKNQTQAGNTWSIFGIEFKKTGLEWPLLAWLISSLLSTIFSQNTHISIHGTYDRWEGIITTIHYIVYFWMLTQLIRTKNAIHIIYWAILVMATVSGFYGIYQSLGLETINWSMNPASRVFASINNPVHFCAFMGMCLPLAIGLIAWITHTKEQIYYKKRFIIALYILSGIIFYSMFLSYSRATWLGFLLCFIIQLCFLFQLFNDKSLKTYLSDLFATLSLIAITFIISVFHFQTYSIKVAIILATLLFLNIAFLYYVAHPQKEKKLHPSQLLANGLSVTVFFILFFIPEFLGIEFPLWLGFVLHGLLIATCFSVSGKWQSVFNKLIIIYMMISFQFITLSLPRFTEFSLLFVSFFILNIFRAHIKIDDKIKTILVYIIYLFSSILVLSILFLALIKPSQQLSSAIIQSTQHKIQKISSLESVVTKGNPRTSMWKSSFPWIQDYWALGTGLDTIKYMFPQYRRSEYGLLEGGHNMTPDRLHNEYLNTLASKGVIGFVAYFFVFLLAWALLMASGIYRFRHRAESHLLIAGFCAVLLYYGQVLFNFGVVPTLVLLYTIMGLSIALLHYLKQDHEKK